MSEKIQVLVMGAGGAAIYDAIQFEEEVWIVPRWLAGPYEKRKKPERIIPLAELRPAMLPATAGLKSYLVQTTIPDSVLKGMPTLEQRKQYRVRLQPDVSFPTE